MNTTSGGGDRAPTDKLQTTTASVTHPLSILTTKLANGSNQRRQLASNLALATCNRPLHLNLWGGRTEAEDINSASALGRRVGDDHALGDIRCLLTYRLAPPCASLSNEFSEVGAATPDLIFSH